MSDEPITKRLHISGLTPAITAADLTRRLGSYGAVTALDGLGKRDALDNARPYAYATLSTTKGKLAKCMNVLSGSVWKGAKLRVGEAKPDFRDRIAAENAKDADPRPSKRRRIGAVHAPDMSPITAERARAHPAWTVTQLGRLIRPVKMRPAHPLDPPIDVLQPQSSKEGKKKRKKADAPTRARRRLIDPLRWGSTQIKGVFLEGQAVGLKPREVVMTANESVSDSEESDAGEASEKEVTLPVHTAPFAATKLAAPASNISVPTVTTALISASVPTTMTAAPDLQKEKKQTLSLLASLFSGDDWGGAEELSDVEMEAVVPTPASRAGANADEYEVVPRSMTFERGPIEFDEEGSGDGATSGDEEHNEESASNAPKPASVTPLVATTQNSKLAELFAPQEEQGFSLFGNLDDDLDLDLDLDLGLTPAAISAPTLAVATAPRSLVSESQSAVPPVFAPIREADIKFPLFFPASIPARGGKTVLSALAEIAEPATFVGSLDENGRRERWEAQKKDLTTTWKKRSREAAKGRRRRGGVDV